MDTASSLVFRHAHVLRLAAALFALVFVGLSLLVVLGASVDAALQPATDDTLLGPFRWSLRRGVA